MPALRLSPVAAAAAARLRPAASSAPSHAACAPALQPRSRRGALSVTAHAGCEPTRPAGRAPPRLGPGAGASRAPAPASAAASSAPVGALSSESERAAFLDSLKYDNNGLVVAIAQHVDTGAILMQAFANREAVETTLTSRKATFYSRSRNAQWMKGESSGNVIHVTGVYIDCDRDSLIYLGDPVGPTCHTGAETCYFTRVQGESDAPAGAGGAALSTLYDLEATIAARKAELAAGVTGKLSWTQKLLNDPVLLCKKVREEAGELCQTLEASEGKERAASEMADVLYHSMVLLSLQGVDMAEVFEVLRGRFGKSGIAEKAARPPKN